MRKTASGSTFLRAAGFDVPDELVMVLSGGVVRESIYKVVWRRGHDVGAELERIPSNWQSMTRRMPKFIVGGLVGADSASCSGKFASGFLPEESSGDKHAFTSCTDLKGTITHTISLCLEKQVAITYFR